MGTSYADAIVIPSDDSSHGSFDSMPSDEQPAEKLMQLRGIYEDMTHKYGPINISIFLQVNLMFDAEMITSIINVLLQDLNTGASQTLISSVCLETTCI